MASKELKVFLSVVILALILIAVAFASLGNKEMNIESALKKEFGPVVEIIERDYKGLKTFSDERILIAVGSEEALVEKGYYVDVTDFGKQITSKQLITKEDLMDILVIKNHQNGK